MRKPRILTALVIAVLAAACGAGDDGSDRLQIVVTTSVWGDVVAEVVGEDADVEVLIPRGADAHDYQPTPQQVAAIGQADLVVSNGLGLEEGLDDILDSAEQDGATVLAVAPELDPIPFAEEEGHEEEGDGDEEHEHGHLDPHVWFDPMRVAEGAGLIAAELTAIDPGVDWMEGAASFAEELAAADDDIRAILTSIAPEARKLVTNHDSLEYFADTYGFEVVGVIVPGGSTLGDPSSAELAALVDVIRSEDVSAIFTETVQPSDLADAIAAEVGQDVAVVELYTESLGPEDGPAGTLIDMLTENARLISAALS